jgi:outer membrane immunogenic protein
MRIRFWAALAVSVLAGSPALAGPYNWSGFYFGAHGGYGWADTEYPGTNPYVAPPGTCANAFGPGQHCGSPRPELEGGLIGAQIGYNYQIDQFVIGAELDYSFTKMQESLRDGNYLIQDHEISSLASIRGRLGYSFGDILPYITGGWAWSDMSVGQSCPDPAAVVAGHCNTNNNFAPYNLSKDKTETGWVYGAGVETLIAKYWSIRAEYLRYDFDEEVYVVGTTASGRTIPAKVLKHDVDTVRLGVNYNFGGF